MNRLSQLLLALLVPVILACLPGGPRRSTVGSLPRLDPDG